MHLSSLQPLSTPHAYICGDVFIDPSAVIAPGALLQADPGSSIVIEGGACIGMGAIVHACEGQLTIEAGANIGAGALIVGEVHIGRNACIGSTSTIYNSSVSSCALIAPGSLLFPTPDNSPVAPVSSAPEMPYVAELTEVRAQTTSHGQEQLNRLMVKIFPNRPQSFS